MQSGGVPLLNQKVGSVELDPSLVGGFISAISAFGKQISQQDLKSIEFGEYRWLMIQGRCVNAVIVVDPEDDATQVKPALEELLSRFEEKYSSYLKDWTGNTVPFSNFSDIVINSIKFPLLDEISEIHKLKKKFYSREYQNVAEYLNRVGKKFDSNRLLGTPSNSVNLFDKFWNKSVEVFDKLADELIHISGHTLPYMGSDYLRNHIPKKEQYLSLEAIGLWSQQLIDFYKRSLYLVKNVEEDFERITIETLEAEFLDNFSKAYENYKKIGTKGADKKLKNLTKKVPGLYPTIIQKERDPHLVLPTNAQELESLVGLLKQYLDSYS
jgi:hypothetical protein